MMKDRGRTALTLVESRTLPLRRDAGAGPHPAAAMLGSRYPDVNGFSLHVQTMASHAGMRAARNPGHTVSTDHVDLATGTVDESSQVIKKVEKAGIRMPDVSGTMITQIVIELVQCLGGVTIIATVSQIEPLVRVGVVETEPVFSIRLDAQPLSLPSGTRTQRTVSHKAQRWRSGSKAGCTRCFQT